MMLYPHCQLWFWVHHFSRLYSKVYKWWGISGVAGTPKAPKEEALEGGDDRDGEGNEEKSEDDGGKQDDSSNVE